MRRHFGLFLAVALATGGVLQWTFGLTQSVVAGAGRDMTLTGRTDVWRAALALAANPWLGAGFESFWLGDRLRAMWAQFAFQPNEAHNGYLEVYLNLGWLGLFLLGGVLIRCYVTQRRRLNEFVRSDPVNSDDLVLAKFGTGFLMAYLLYNVTEATFKPLNVLYIVFLLVTIRYRVPEARALRLVPAKSVGPTRNDVTPVVSLRGTRRPVGEASRRTTASFSHPATRPGLDGPTSTGGRDRQNVKLRRKQ